MISIIVPIYNASNYLTVCIESLLHQTVQNLQIIIVDDGSKDDSLTIAQTYALQDKRIEVYERPHAGQSAARNYGLQHAKGEYIAFLDADDALLPDWCEKHLNAITNVDYVQSGYTRIGENLRTEKLPYFFFQFTVPWGRLYRHEAIKNLHFAEGYIYEDVLFSADLWLSGATYSMIHYTGYQYTQNPNSTTAKPHPEAQQRVLKALKKKARNASLKGKLIIYYTYVRLKLYFIRSGSQ